MKKFTVVALSFFIFFGFILTIPSVKAAVADEIIILEEPNTGDFFSIFFNDLVPKWGINHDKFLEQFYKNNTDEYDFIAIFPSKMMWGNYASHINREIDGIGNIYQTVSQYTKNLKSIVILDFWELWKMRPEYDSGSLETIIHEIGHYWLAHMKESFLSGEGSHYVSNLDLFNGDTRYVDNMAFHQWIKKTDQYFCVDRNSASTIMKFSNLSLYLMGLIPPSEVSPITVHEFEKKSGDQHYNIWGPECTDKPIFTGTKTVTINDIISVNGQRKPTFTASQKDFRVAFVILKGKGDEIPNGFIDYIKKYKEALPTAWSKATNGKSTILSPASITVTTPDVKTSSSSLTLLSPALNTSWQKRTPQAVTWTSVGIPPSTIISYFRLKNTDGRTYDLPVSTYNDGSELVIMSSTVPVGSYRLEIKAMADGQIYLSSSNLFKVVENTIADKVAPVTPLNVSVKTSAYCGGLIDLSWSPVTGATGYKVYASPSSKIITVPKVVSSASFVDKISTQTYYSYNVTAFNSIGESLKSTTLKVLSSPACITANSSILKDFNLALILGPLQELIEALKNLFQ